MTSLIKKAKSGNSDAFIKLYEMNKQTVYALCELLLCDFNSADSAHIHVFKAAWQGILDGKIQSEKEFKEFVVNKAVNHCKNKIYKSDSKAFKLPQNKNFIISSFDKDKNYYYDDIYYAALVSLPAIHRFIYVLDAYAEWSNDEIAEVLHAKAETVELAFEAEKINLEKFAYFIKQERKQDVNISVNDFKEYIFDYKNACEITKSVDSVVLFSIDSIVRPIKDARKKKSLKIGLIAGISFIAALLVTLGIVAICLSQKDNDAAEDDYYDEYDEEYDSIEWLTSVESPTNYAIIDIADYGKITLALDAVSAPETVNNFVALAKSGFYDGLTFHRIIEGFMMQGGDPNADGTGGNTDEDGNEINITGEFYYNGYDNYLSHTRGAISMARADDYNSASSQFFIVQEDCSADLDGSYAVFGFVTNGMDVVDAVCAAAEPTDDNGTVEKADQPIITSIKIYTPEEYAALVEESDSDVTGETEGSTADESITPIDAKIAEVSAISTREQSFFLTIYGLCEESVDYEITDVAKVDLSKYEATEKLEKYGVDSTAKVYEVKDGEIVEFEASKIVEGDMIVIYTDAEDIVNVIVYHSENVEKEESAEETV